MAQTREIPKKGPKRDLGMRRVLHRCRGVGGPERGRTLTDACVAVADGVIGRWLRKDRDTPPLEKGRAVPRNFRTSELVREPQICPEMWGKRWGGGKAQRDVAESGCLKRTLVCLA